MDRSLYFKCTEYRDEANEEGLRLEQPRALGRGARALPGGSMIQPSTMKTAHIDLLQNEEASAVRSAHASKQRFVGIKES